MRHLLALIALSLITAPAEAVDVLTSRNDLARSVVNAAERTLTPASVNAQRFGKLWTLYADGQIVAQPLYVSSLAVDTGTNPDAPRVLGTFNAVLVATMHITVYLYDADRERPGPEGRTVPLWATWLGQPRPGGKDIDMWSTNDGGLCSINQRGAWVSHWVPTPWRNTQLHDYAGQVADARTNADGWVELWIPPVGDVMMAPLRTPSERRGLTAR